MQQELSGENLYRETVQMVMGAGSSIDIITPVELEFQEQPARPPITESLVLADSRIPIRRILGFPKVTMSHDYASASQLTALFQDWVYTSWAVRFVSDFDGDGLLLVDRERALVTQHDRTSSVLIESRSQVRRFEKFFENLWVRAGTLEGLYEDEVIASEPENIQRILTVSREQWDSVISYFANNPDKLYSIDPHKLEELVAELLEREGMRVQLTPPSRDGGRDILAFVRTPIGEHLHLVECKRYSPLRPIRVDLVRNLYGVIEAERATSGLLVATSRFTKEAIDFREQVKYRLSLKDYDELVKWLKSASRDVSARD